MSVRLMERHEKAMELADFALRARQSGNEDQARVYFEQAFLLERAAAESIVKKVDLEPTRSVLLRSAATLALDIGNAKEAARLAHTALSGNPPSEIAYELYELLEEINFKRHLELRGITLQAEAVQMSLDGDSIGPGIGEGEAVARRVRDAGRLLFRTAERKQGQAFRAAGLPKSEIGQRFGLYWEAPRSQCFAITLRLGKPTKQLAFESMSSQAEVIQDFLTCLHLFNSGNADELREMIGDKDYFENFAALASGIAPDGKKVRHVGFTSTREGQLMTATLDKRAQEIRLEETGRSEDAKPSTTGKPVARAEFKIIEGILEMGDRRAVREGSIILVDTLGIEHRVKVPKSLMDDIVRPNWGQHVRAEVLHQKGRLTFRRLLETE